MKICSLNLLNNASLNQTRNLTKNSSVQLQTQQRNNVSYPKISPQQYMAMNAVAFGHARAVYSVPETIARMSKQEILSELSKMTQATKNNQSVRRFTTEEQNIFSKLSLEELKRVLVLAKLPHKDGDLCFNGNDIVKLITLPDADFKRASQLTSEEVDNYKRILLEELRRTAVRRAIAKYGAECFLDPTCDVRLEY